VPLPGLPTLAAVLAHPRWAEAHSVGLVAAAYGSDGHVWRPSPGLPTTAAFQARAPTVYEDLATGVRLNMSKGAFAEETFKIKSAVRSGAGARSGRCGSHLFGAADDPTALRTVALDGQPFRGCGCV